MNNNENSKKEEAGVKSAQRRKFTGAVVRVKMAKTAVIRVDRVKTAPKYGKRYAASRKFKVHDERGACREGDMVTFEECRPLSRDKRWRVIYNDK